MTRTFGPRAAYGRPSARQRGLGRWALGMLILTLMGAVAVPASSEDSLSASGRSPSEAEQPDPESTSPGASVELESLLRLPSDMSFQSQRRHGASAEQWKIRFRESRESIDHAQQEVKRVKGELDEMAGDGGGGQWQVAPPGSNQTEVQPMSFKLREELRRSRDNLVEAERGHRELQVEADLADVPQAWRGEGS